MNCSGVNAGRLTMSIFPEILLPLRLRYPAVLAPSSHVNQSSLVDQDVISQGAVV